MYQYLLDKFLSSDLYLVAQIRVGYCYYQMGFYDKTTEALEPLLPRPFRPAVESEQLVREFERRGSLSCFDRRDGRDRGVGGRKFLVIRHS